MKSLSVKIPLTTAQHMDDRGQLNPIYLTRFISTYLNKGGVHEPIQELTYNYTFKVEDDLHKLVKLKAIDLNLPMNELIGRLLARFY